MFSKKKGASWTYDTPSFNYASFLVEIFGKFYAIDCMSLFYFLVQSIAHKKEWVLACLFAIPTFSN